MSAPIMAALAAGALILGAPVFVATASVTASARAASAADSAALAAADNLIGLNAFGSGHGSDSGSSNAENRSAGPCAVAAEIAALYDAVLHSCTSSEETLDVRVEVRTRAGPFVLTRTARAGPPNTPATGSSHTHG